jgi:hypothetical protein
MKINHSHEIGEKHVIFHKAGQEIWCLKCACELKLITKMDFNEYFGT